MKKQIVETQNREKLAEGRNSGMGFAFLQKKKEIYETVNALSPCKDFLNEVVFTENTGIGSQAHGLKYHQKLNIFGRFGYLAIKLVDQGKYGPGCYYYGPSLEIDSKILEDNYKNIEKLLHYFEENLEVKGRSNITKVNDDYYLVRVPREWTRSTPNISLYTLLIRVAMVYDGERDPIGFLEDYNYNKGDKDLLQPALVKIRTLLEKKELIKQPPFDKELAMKKAWSPHDLGILSVNI
jgi:hypothetical protein